MMALGSTRRFFLLEEAVPTSEVETMIGRVVADPLRPQADFVPNPALDVPGLSSFPSSLPLSSPSALPSGYRSPGTIVPGINPMPTQLANVTLTIAADGSTSVGANAGSLLDVRLARHTANSAALTARLVRRHALAGLDSRKTRRYFELLMADGGYSAAVGRLVRDCPTHEAYFVVGFVTAEGARWKRSLATRKQVALRAEVPVATIASGLPVDLGVGGGPEMSSGHEVVAEYDVEQEQIFAVAYDVVKRVKKLDVEARWLVRRKIEHQGLLKPKTDHLAMGSEKEDDDSENDEMDQRDRGGEGGWEVLHSGGLDDIDS